MRRGHPSGRPDSPGPRRPSARRVARLAAGALRGETLSIEFRMEGVFTMKVEMERTTLKLSYQNLIVAQKDSKYGTLKLE